MAISFQKANIVGSFGSLADLQAANANELSFCDVLEIRLDILKKDGWLLGEKPWAHLKQFPLLFTARVKEEGGVLDWNVTEREAAVLDVLADAAAVDIESKSANHFPSLLAELHKKNIAWIASYHDFTNLPSRSLLDELLSEAKINHASVFKIAAQVKNQLEIDSLIQFQKQKSQLPISTMGMGELATSSRVLCAKAGSVLNYGFIGQTKTAPGQCTARKLHDEISA